MHGLRQAEMCGMLMPWQSTEHTSERVRCDHRGLQDKKHPLSLCSCVPLDLRMSIISCKCNVLEAH
eukprot:1159399-Pelagomonas_calceolata.AAC.1